MTLAISRISISYPYILALAASLSLIGMLQDMLHAFVRGYAYYTSESLLFSSFWPLFPLIFLGQRAIFSRPGMATKGYAQWWLLATVCCATLHLLLFPAVVHLGSALFLDHTFHFGTGLRYAVAEDLYVCLIGYGLLMGWPLAGGGRVRQPLPPTFPAPAAPPTLAVRSGRMITVVQVNELWYARSAKPYVALHSAGKKQLLDRSLAQLEQELVPLGWVRVHKSTLVNLRWVRQCTSRRNGDYDLLLEGGDVLRLSRYYREKFLAAWSPPRLGE